MRLIYLLHCCFDGHHWYCTLLHSKNGGMKFIPNEYDIHPNEFYTYGMNSASMTCIQYVVHTVWREDIPHTEAACALHTALANRVIRSKVKQMVEGKSIYVFKKFLHSERCMQCSRGAAHSLKSRTLLVEIFGNLDWNLKSEIWNLKTFRNLVI